MGEKSEQILGIIKTISKLGLPLSSQQQKIVCELRVEISPLTAGITS